jgi:hypothetical protein
MQKSFSVYTLTRLTKSCLCCSLLAVAGLPVLHMKWKSARRLSLVGLRWEVKTTWCVNFLSLCIELGIDKAWIGESRPVTYHAYIWGEVPFAEPARPCPYRRLAITPSRHPGPFLLLSPCAIRTDFPAMTNLNTLPTARLDTHRSRRPRTHLSTAVRRAS